MQYLLDTNILSELIDDPRSKIGIRIRKIGEAQICTSIIVAAEMRFGAAKKQSPRLSKRVDELLRTIIVMPFGPPADYVYGELRARLERAGRPISGNDMLIAAHALALGCTLITANEREFSQVAGLRCENWLRA